MYHWKSLSKSRFGLKELLLLKKVWDHKLPLTKHNDCTYLLIKKLDIGCF